MCFFIDEKITCITSKRIQRMFKRKKSENVPETRSRQKKNNIRSFEEN